MKSMKTINSDEGYLVIITACIDPSSGPAKVVRNDPLVRLEDYKHSLASWLSMADRRLQKILFIENSGYPLDALNQLVSASNPFNKQVEFVSLCCNNYPPDLHYGYAELNMIDEAFVTSKLLKESRYFIKATGRLTFPQLPRLLNLLSEHYLFAVDCRKNSFLTRSAQVFVTTQLMLFSTLFYKQHLLNAKSELNKERTHIENLLYEKLIPFEGQQGAILRWPVNVDPVGYAAHWHKKYDSSKQKAINLARAICRVVFPNWWI